MGIGLMRKGPRLLGVALFLFSATLTLAQPVGPRVSAVRFSGNLPFTIKKAREIVDIELGRPVAPETAQAAAERLREACISRYHPMAQVTWQADQDQFGRMVLFFFVDPGPKGRLIAVRFQGNRAIPSAELRQQLGVVPREGLIDRVLRRDVIKVEQLAADRRALQQYYLKLGYAAVEVDPARFEWLSSRQGFVITWPILNEGPVHRIGYVSFDADVLPPAAQLEQLVGFRAGDAFDSREIALSRARLEQYFLERGYGFSRVGVDVQRHADAPQADIHYEIEAGEEVFLRQILLRGNQLTQDRIVRREIPVRRGDRFDIDALNLAQARLSSMPMFQGVAIDYQAVEQPNQYDLYVDVVERRTGRLEAGIVYGEIEGGAALFRVSELNLSHKPPFRGAALQGNAAVMAGPKILRLDSGLRNPRLGSSSFSLDGHLFYEDNEYLSEEYDQRTLGGSLILGHPVGRHHFIGTGYSASFYELYNQSDAFAERFADEDDDTRLTSWVFLWNMDRTDQVMRPTKGFRLRANLRLGSEALGGNTEVIQTSTGGSIFFNPYGDHIISLRGGYQTVDPYGSTDSVPVPLRVYLGGVSDLRGFGYRTVSPLDDQGSPRGGQSAWSATAEYLWPVQRRIDLAFYVDVGDVSTESFSFSGVGPVSNWGLGFLIRADNFPVRFDVAFPIASLDGDRLNEKGKRRLSFSAGYRY
jgi:outer membrane protein insertion porin family